MHREIQNHIEDVLAGTESALHQQHLAECEACREKVRHMQDQALLLRGLRVSQDDMEPRAGFYARVMERIEAQGPISIWNLFIESAFGRRIAVASMALALLLGIYLVSAERSMDEPVTASEQAEPAAAPLSGSLVVADEDAPGRVITQMGQSADDQSGEDAVLANLVTYQEQ